MLSYEIYNYYSFVNDKLEEMNKVFNILFDWKEKYNDKCEHILNKILTSKTTSSGNETHYIIQNGGIVKSFDEVMEELQKSFNAITVTIKYGAIKKEIETSLNEIQINLENNYKDLAIKAFKDSSELIEKYHNTAAINEKTYIKYKQQLDEF